ncbi:uncharacterized protein MELLADRAFT_117772 [Melampsora larici-populina 98AG31]|uniref:LIM zinc-binding domain-containing protein n=1 Tax=Melampsora larici-populina (strain 98AG31 / pathotype 3-4-7) TaxID=747676 RepID=F4S1F5_MELLP|nr:uncharacterized protein MELLADRAFT_117772 [Melampsora larici-populina 98AG31]EGG01555.1 hypothetical protein MELLADRAFT_117772 [Melampsora larici-populina 98AG31]
MSRTPRTDESTSYYQPITTATRQSSIKRPLPPVPPISSSYHQHQPHQQHPYPYPQTSNHFQPNQFHPQPQHFQSQTQFQPYPYYQQPQSQWSQTPIRNPSSQAPPLPPPPTPQQVPKSLPSHPIPINSISQETFEQPPNPYYPTPFPISSHSHPSINPLSRTLSTNHSSHFSPKRNLPNLPLSSHTNPSIAINPISSNQTQDGSYHSTSNRITRTGSLQGARPLPNQETVHQPLITTPSKPLPAPPSDPNVQRTYQETPSTFSNLVQPSRPASKPTPEPFEITISSNPELTVVPSVPVLKIEGIDEESEDESINQSQPTITLSSTPEPGTNSVPVPIIVTTEEEDDSSTNRESNPSNSKARPTPVPLLVTEPSPSSPTSVPVPTSQVSDPTSSTEPNQLQSLFCGGCHQLIAGRIVNALNQRWHPDCFKCEHCLMVLEHVAFYEHQGKAYCGVDYDEFFSLKCHHCNTSITDESYVTLDEPNLIGSPRHYHQLHLFCAECGDPFLDPKSLEESSRISKRSLPPQPQQPNQSTVKKMIEPNPFVLHKGYPYCESCHLKLHKPKCFGCKTSMVGDIINAMGKQWHEDCFVCKDCKKPFLNGMFFLFQSNPFCEPCYSVQLKQTF